jgi:predicted nucleic acid-binding protein
MKTERLIVSDTGPLITLEKLTDGYPFIRRLYERIVIPLTVLEELYQGQFGSPEAYLSYYDVAKLLDVVEVGPGSFPALERLDRGEQDAIHLAQQRGLPLLIEEEAGRVVARQLGITISGIAGQVLRAFREKILTREEALGKLQELFAAGRINTRIYRGLVEEIERKV